MKLNEVAISQLFEGCLVKVKKPINMSCPMKQTNWHLSADNYGHPMPLIDIKIPAEYFKIVEINGDCITIDFFRYDHNWEQPVIEMDNLQLDDVCNEYNKKCFRNKEQNERNEAIRYIGDAIASAIRHYC